MGYQGEFLAEIERLRGTQGVEERVTAHFVPEDSPICTGRQPILYRRTGCFEPWETARLEP